MKVGSAKSEVGSKNGATPHRNGGGAPRRVMLFPARKLIEVAPGIRMANMQREHVPEIAISRLQSCGDGTYRPVWKTYEPMMRLTEAVKILHTPYATLRRLCRAGFVESAHIAPNNIQINLSSWFEHVDKVRKDPEFWGRKENMRRYRDAL
jgi:hypothetical protein